MTATYLIVNDSGLLCGRCGRISYNPTDVQELYCVVCKLFHVEAETTAQDRLTAVWASWLITQHPLLYRHLSGLVRSGVSLEALHDRYLTSIAREGDATYTAAYLVAEWLIANKEAKT